MTREVWRLAKKTVRSIYREVAKLAKEPDADADEIEELSAWAKASERRERIAASCCVDNMINLDGRDHFFDHLALLLEIDQATA